MSTSTKDYGPTSEQIDRMKSMPWPMFVEFVELLSLDPDFYTSAMPPASRALEFRSNARAAQLTPFAVEVALQWATQAQRVHLKKALILLDLTGEEGSEGSAEWLSQIGGEAEVGSFTLGSLKAALDEVKGKRLGSSLSADDAWKGTDVGSLEKIMGKENTLLPTSFLKVALQRSASVAKIETPNGSGSGFVIAGNLLVTNAHVLPDLTTARSSKAVFSFEKSEDGLDLTPIEIKTDPDRKFLVSPSAEHDLAVVALSEEADGRWSEIEVTDVSIKKDKRVCIIQHPGGDQKHIGMYHNIVTYVDDQIVQYLTDTLPGSSGSPVFNQYWELVAIHHAGGWLKEPGRKEKLFRNEGIHVSHLIELLASAE